MHSTDYELTAGDLMTLEPVTIEVDATIEEAQRLILEFRVSGLPVVDTNGALAGVISQTDFMHLERPDIEQLIHHRSSGIRVGEVMSRPAITVSSSTPLAAAARTMLDNRVHRLVVVDKDRRPKGVLSAIDFVQLYADE